MREYGQVQSAFWQSNDAQAWTDTGKLLALYLLTGPHSNGIGCYRLPDGYVMADLCWSSERVSKGFEELSSNGFAYRYDMVVFIPNFLRWNSVANGNVAVARFKEFDALPKGASKALVANAMLGFGQHWNAEQTTVMQTVYQTLPEGYANQNPTPPKPTQPRSKGSADRFQDFWAAYPVKKGKADAEAKWRSMGLDASADLIIADVKARIASDRQWQNPQYIPHGSTYVNGRGWEDGIESGKPNGGGYKPLPGEI